MTTTDPYFLSHGSHATAEAGRCAMEWVAHLAGEPHSDQPVCVSPVLRRFCISLNDRLPDDERQRLRPYLARTIGTADDGRDDERMEILRRWLLRDGLPARFERIGMQSAAKRLRGLPESVTWLAVERVLIDARGEAEEARARARAELRAKVRGAIGAIGASAAIGAIAAIAAIAAIDAIDASGASGAIAAIGAIAASDDPSAPYNAAYRVFRKAADEALADFIRSSRREAFELLERMLPTVPVQLPVAEDAEAVCALS